MARQCYKLNLNGVDYKLRITLSAQKEFMERYPGTPVVAAIVSSFEDPADMEFLLSKALNWDGNENKIRSGEAFYDELVDAGYRGNEAFLKLALGIAHNAGLLSDEEMKKVERKTLKLLRSGMDSAMEDAEDGEEGEEGPENPPEPKTLDG